MMHTRPVTRSPLMCPRSAIPALLLLAVCSFAGCNGDGFDGTYANAAPPSIYA
ncbi:MAG: hypothetical protein JRI25_25250 [Deltaproteobacteria bacterium]|nr:hypothetical protein [Deltaproteobacteria bacterium]